MEFLNKLGSTAESLLEQVDKQSAAISLDIRTGNRAARNAAERIEKSLELAQQSQNKNDSREEIILKLQADLAACGEVLSQSQHLAAERETKLTAQLLKQRQEKEERESELLRRIHKLETDCAHLSNQLVDTSEQLKRLQPQQKEEEKKDDDDNINDVHKELESAKVQAEHYKQALCTATKESSNRIAELERSNLELVVQLGEATQSVYERRRDLLPIDMPSPAYVAELEREIVALKQRISMVQAENATLETKMSTEQHKTLALAQELKSNQIQISELSEVKRELVLTKQELEARKSEPTNSEVVKSLEARLETLGRHVEWKQRQIDSLRSEQVGNRRVSTTSAQELHSPPPPHLLAKPQVRRFRVENKGLDGVLAWLDGLAMSAAHAMRASPGLRLVFLVYLLVLHGWVFHVVNMGGSGGDLKERNSPVFLRGGNEALIN